MVGGFSVWLRLNPWMVGVHFVLSAVMIALALASLATSTVLQAKGWELARQARQLRAARALLLSFGLTPLLFVSVMTLMR